MDDATPGVKLRAVLLSAGWIGVAISVVWWLAFYGSISGRTGAGIDNALACLFVTTNLCAIAQNVASFAGYIPYSPFVLWLSIVAVGLGFIAPLFVAGGTEIGAAVTTSSESTYDRAKWKALLEYDSDLFQVARKIDQLGKRWADKFAADYLAINNKEYLAAIAQKIIADARAYDASAQSGSYHGYKFKLFSDGRVEVDIRGEVTSFPSEADFCRYINVIGPAPAQ